MNEPCSKYSIVVFDPDLPIAGFGERTFHLSRRKDRTEPKRVRTLSPFTEDLPFFACEISCESRYCFQGLQR